jgi:hypothetical protein
VRRQRRSRSAAEPQLAVTDDRVAVKRLASRISGKRSKNLTSAIYGTILATAVLTGIDAAEPVTARRALAILLATGTVVWAAHVYAHLLADRLEGRHRMKRGDIRRVMSDQWPLLQSTLVPATPLALGALEIVARDAALNLARLACVATLFGWGWVFSRREGHGYLGRAGAGALNACVGLFIIGLELALTAEHGG